MIETASFETAILTVVMKNTLYASVIFLCVSAVVRFVPRRYALLRYMLWSLVFIRLVLPPTLVLPFSAGELIHAGLASFENTPFAFSTGEAPTAEDNFQGNFEETTQPILIGAKPSRTILLFAWLTGVLLVGTVLSRRRREFVTLSRDAGVVEDPHLLECLDRWRRVFNVRRKIVIRETHSDVPAFTIHTLRPAIVVPSRLRTQDETQKEKHRFLESIIAHEVAHIARLDDLALQLKTALSAIYFFNPFVWIAASRMRAEADIVCDRLVLSRQTLSPRVYGTALLHAATHARLWPGVPAFATTGSHLKKRITTIMTSPIGSSRPFASVLGALGFAFILLPMGSRAPVIEQDVAVSVQQEPQFQHPLPQARMSSGFGMRRHPIEHDMRMHSGIDLATVRGTPVKASAPGTVEFAALRGNWGNLIIINHGDGYHTYYAQLDSMAVEVNDHVAAGETVGTVGESGQATAPHLHFEVHLDGEPVDPAGFNIGT